MSGRAFIQMKKLNEQFEEFIRLQAEAKQEAVQAAEAAEKALRKETATIKALNLTYNRKGKLVRNGNVLVNEFGQEVNRVGEVVSNFNKRTTVLTKAIEDLNTQGKSFEVFSKATRKAYMDAGGNIFEFLAESIAGTREEITIFGQEGAKIRKFMYGFLPPGTFRALNRASSLLQAIGSATRRASRSTQDYKDDIERLKTAQSKLNKDTQEEEYNNLQKTIDKMREDMKQGGGNILGTTIKALGKIPRLGKFTKAFGETREQTRNNAESTLVGLRGFFGQEMSIDEARARKRELKSKMASRYGSGAHARTPEEDTELEALNEILKPLGSIGGIMDAIDTSLIGYGKFFMSLEENFKKFRGFIFKAWKKAFPEGLIKGLGNFIKMGMKFIFTIMIYITMFFALVYFFRKPIQEIGKRLGEFIKNDWPKFKAAFSSSLTLLKDSIIDIYEGFRDGDLMKIFVAIWGVAWSILEIAFTSLKLLGAVLYVAAKAFVARQLERVINFFMGGFGSVKEGLKTIGIALLILVGIFAFWPTVIATAFIGGFYALGKFLTSRIPFMASGGVAKGGLTVVGERGPELVNLPRGARVHSNAESRRMGGTVNNFNITVNAKDSSKAEMRRMADEIGRMINSKINRSTSSSTLR